MKNKKTIFFADRPEVKHLAQTVAEDFFDLKFCSSLEEAKASLGSSENAGEIGLIACGLHFDDGRMYELLRFAKSNEKTRSIPFLCIKMQKGKMTSSMLDSIRTSSEMMGAQGFLHLPDLVSMYGEHPALVVFRKTLHDLLETGEHRSNAHEGKHRLENFSEGIRQA